MTAPDFKALGLALAYKHVVPFLESRGGLQPVEEIYGYVATQGLVEGAITVQQIRHKDYWREFVTGIHRVNPSVWSARLMAAHGDSLPIVCGDPTPRGYWALESYYKPTAQPRKRDFLMNLLGGFRNLEVTD